MVNDLVEKTEVSIEVELVPKDLLSVLHGDCVAVRQVLQEVVAEGFDGIVADACKDLVDEDGGALDGTRCGVRVTKSVSCLQNRDRKGESDFMEDVDVFSCDHHKSVVVATPT